MNFRNLIATAIAVFLSSTTWSAFAPTYRISFPRIALKPDEQIEGFRVTVACAHIEAVRTIPKDWNIEVESAVSSVETFRASAGHGISYVRQLDLFDGSIQLSDIDDSCFDIKATVTATFDEDRQIPLTRRQLKLVAVTVQ